MIFRVPHADASAGWTFPTPDIATRTCIVVLHTHDSRKSEFVVVKVLRICVRMIAHRYSGDKISASVYKFRWSFIVPSG